MKLLYIFNVIFFQGIGDHFIDYIFKMFVNYYEFLEWFPPKTNNPIYWRGI